MHPRIVAVVEPHPSARLQVPAVARASWIGCAALVAACVASGCGSSADGGERHSTGAPDIVLVSIESLRFDHLGGYGYTKPTSPSIDRIASQGVRCECAVSTTSWTLPAHAAMMTGLFDSTHGVVGNGARLSDARPSLAAVLRGNGYQTAGFFGGPYLHPAFGFGHGFSHYESCMSSANSAGSGAGATAALASDRAPSQAELDRSHGEQTGPRTLEAVTRWLSREADERPLFLFVHLWDVHYDYDPPREYVEMFDPGYDGTLDASDLARNPAINDRMAPRDLDHLIALYDGEIRFTDEILGKILAALERRGRMQDTLLVITADHGEEFFEHGGKGHQRTLFDEVVRVPLIVRWPGRFAGGSVVHDQVRLVDLMPTLLACGGVAKLPEVQGRDVTPLLRGEPMTPAPALCELYVDRNDLRALRTNAFKVVEWADQGTVLGFDLALDAHEQRPLPAELEPVASVHRGLEAALDAASAFKKRIGASALKLEMPAELGRSFGALGYAGDDSRPAASKPR